jgi:hypothetical protein
MGRSETDYDSHVNYLYTQIKVLTQFTNLKGLK